MTERNKIKLGIIATKLTQLESNRTINNREGFDVLNVRMLNDLGKEILEILNDELRQQESKKENQIRREAVIGFARELESQQLYGFMDEAEEYLRLLEQSHLSQQESSSEKGDHD